MSLRKKRLVQPREAISKKKEDLADQDLPKAEAPTDQVARDHPAAAQEEVTAEAEAVDIAEAVVTVAVADTVEAEEATDTKAVAEVTVDMVAIAAENQGLTTVSEKEAQIIRKAEADLKTTPEAFLTTMTINIIHIKKSLQAETCRDFSFPEYKVNCQYQK
jgi:membrane protein involved in colicin uptake